MRKTAIVLTLVLAVLLGGCVAGPHQLFRTVDDWDQELYVNSPWLDAVLWIIPVVPFARFGAMIGDTLITDAYAFWFKDAFSGGKGTGFRHKDAEAEKYMNSLLSDEGEFLKIEGETN